MLQKSHTFHVTVHITTHNVHSRTSTFKLYQHSETRTEGHCCQKSARSRGSAAVCCTPIQTWCPPGKPSHSGQFKSQLLTATSQAVFSQSISPTYGRGIIFIPVYKGKEPQAQEEVSWPRSQCRGQGHSGGAQVPTKSA